MPRYHNINGEKVQFTDAEETARDAEETAAQNSKAPDAWKLIRNTRNRLLADTDWWSASDISDAFSDARKKYRKDLRDLPSTISDPTADVTWPTKPS